MAFTLKKLTNEPIVIVTVEPPTTDYFESEATLIHAHLDLFAQQIDAPPLYCIQDARHLDIDFSDILLWIDETAQGRPGSAVDERLQFVVVGTHPLLEVGVRKVRKQLDLDVPLFPTVSQALDYIRARS
jgi:hypothetical protein